MLPLAPSRASTLFGQGVATFQFLKFRLYGHDWIIETLTSRNVGRRLGMWPIREIEKVKPGASAEWVARGHRWHTVANTVRATTYIT
jgi:hypothetical protein